MLRPASPEDPIRFWGGANFYGYVFNSPTSFTDPLGLCDKKPVPNTPPCLSRSMLTAAERAELNAASFYAQLFNKTVGFGIGASGAMNLIPDFYQFGFGGATSSMLVADAKGNTALVSTITVNGANFGAGINGGLQFSYGHEPVIPGWSGNLSASGSFGAGLGFGADLTNSGTLTLNFGVGLGAKYSATMSNLNFSYALPICK